MGFPSPLFSGNRNRETSGTLTLTAGAANTMSGWVTALTLKNNASLLRIVNSSGTGSQNIALNLGLGSTPSVIVPALFFHYASFQTQYLIPLSLPSGTVISVQSQSPVASEVSYLILDALDSEAEDEVYTQWGQFGVILSSNTGLTALATSATWTSVGTVGFNVRQLVLASRDTGSTNPVTLQLGYGTSTASVTPVGNTCMRASSSANVANSSFSCAIPSGQNLYVQSNTTTTIYGVWYGG